MSTALQMVDAPPEVIDALESVGRCLNGLSLADISKVLAFATVSVSLNLDDEIERTQFLELTVATMGNYASQCEIQIAIKKALRQ